MARASSQSFSQIACFTGEVLSYVGKHKQAKFFSTEAGGQLFGEVGDREIVLKLATGPYRGDLRGRYHYQSNQDAAQRSIVTQARAGNLYLGEWHTHAEDRPVASASDADAMERLLASSSPNISPLFMLIVGRAAGEDGLALYSLDSTGLERWKFSAGVSAI